jgi:hypothetical protein
MQRLKKKSPLTPFKKGGNPSDSLKVPFFSRGIEGDFNLFPPLPLLGVFLKHEKVRKLNFYYPDPD